MKRNFKRPSKLNKIINNNSETFSFFVAVIFSMTILLFNNRFFKKIEPIDYDKSNKNEIVINDTIKKPKIIISDKPLKIKKDNKIIKKDTITPIKIDDVKPILKDSLIILDTL